MNLKPTIAILLLTATTAIAQPFVTQYGAPLTSNPFVPRPMDSTDPNDTNNICTNGCSTNIYPPQPNNGGATNDGVHLFSYIAIDDPPTTNISGVIWNRYILVGTNTLVGSNYEWIYVNDISTAGTTPISDWNDYSHGIATSNALVFHEVTSSVITSRAFKFKQIP